MYRQFHGHLTDFNLFFDAVIPVIHPELVVQLIPHSPHRSGEIEFVRIEVKSVREIPRLDHDDLNVETFHLQSKDGRIRLDGPFCDGEWAVKWRRSPVQDGGDIHDPSLALADERQESVCHANDAKQIDRHDLC